MSMFIYRVYAIVFILVFGHSFAISAFSQTITLSEVEDSVGIELDPMYGTTWESLQKLYILFDPLLVSGLNNEPLPGAAESWSISDDGKTYKFQLRKDATFSDGHPVTAEDFVLGFQRIVSPKVGHLPKPNYILGNVKNAQDIIKGDLQPEQLGITAISDYELEIELINPASYFSSILTYPGLVAVPKHKIKKFGDGWSKKEHFVSNGPMHLQSVEHKKLVYVKNENHWSKLGYDKLITNLLKKETYSAKDLLLGKSDLALNVRRNQRDWAKENSELEYFKGNLNSVHYGIFNTKMIKDKRIRKALQLAIDKDILAMGFGFIPASTFTPLSLWPAKNAVAPNTLNIARDERLKAAQKLLQEAGYDKANPFRIEILVFKALDHDRIASGMRSMWATIGVEAEITVLDTKPFVDRVYSGNFAFCLGYWFGDYEDPMAFLSILHKNATKNFTDWNNDKYNELLDQAILEPSLEKRYILYDQMENLIHDEVPILPIMSPNFDVISSSRISSLRIGLHGLNLRSLELK